MRNTTPPSFVGRRIPVLFTACFGLLCALPCPSQNGATRHHETSWTQWGGPARDFKVGPVRLASSWPKSGPKRLWKRPLGEGYSAIVADGGHLFTMYRDGDVEVLVALRAADGKTVWEHRDTAPPHPKQTAGHGPGPHATPLVMGDRVFAVGFTGRLRCVNKADGRLLWSVDLMKDLGARPHYYGYSSSPIVYRGSLIVLVGGADCGVAAFDPKDGKVRWKSAPSKTSYASPILIDVDGQDQLVFFTETEVVGMSPLDGTRLWGHKVVNFCRTNCTSALWGDDNLLFAATKGVGGTRVLRLSQKDGKTTVEEVWRSRRIRIYHWNALRIGDRIYTSTGDTGAFHSVVDIKTGEFVMKKRGLGATNGIYADGKLILLDDRGTLLLARPSPDGVEVLSRVQLFDALAWTSPTLVGTTLYVRNREDIMALDLAPAVAVAAGATPATPAARNARSPEARLPEARSRNSVARKSRTTTPQGPKTQPPKPESAKTGLPDAAVVLDRHVAAFGGKSAWQKIRNRVTKMRVIHVGMDLEDAVVEFFAKPNKHYARIETEAFGVMENGCDGKTVWRLTEQQGPVVERDDPCANSGTRSSLERLLDWRARYAKVKCTGRERVDGRLCFRVELTPRKGEPETMFFDVKTHLLARTKTVVTPAGVPPMPIDSKLNDYRRIDGIMIPFHIHQVSEACGTERAMTFLVQSVRHNVKLPKDRFELPETVKAAIVDGSAFRRGCDDKGNPACGDKGDGKKREKK